MSNARTRMPLMLAIGVVLIVGVVWLFRSNSSDDPTPSNALSQPGAAATGQRAPTASTPPTGSAPAGSAQPPGPAPEGKVWNAAHGHWHDAPTGQTPSAEPPGEAPPGKVWNAEHGHYHDAPPEQATPGAGKAGTP
ncbi:MAG: hypothetical protein DHS20C21_03940 [Gemmatimonadota bacterium]|nr:MAG: hypothetical protein DHS20C21_03940 [Gemmatimonadota bacterium]